MANKPATKKPSPKSAGTAKKAKATVKPSGTNMNKAIKKPGFTKEVSDLDLED
jgi:hypothetical protein